MAVVVASLTAGVGAALLDDPETDPVLWVVIAGCGIAGVASAVRLLAVPLLPRDTQLAAMTGGADPDPAEADRQMESLARLDRPSLGDAGWSLLLVVGATAARSVIRVAGFGSGPAELLLPLLMALIWVLAYLIGWIMGLLVAVAGGSSWRLAAARRRGRAVAAEWWAVPAVFAAIAVFAVSAVMSLTLLDAPSSRGLGGFLALVLWDFHDLAGWDLVLAWTTRINGLAIVVSIVVLVVGRVRAHRMPTSGRDGDGEA